MFERKIYIFDKYNFRLQLKICIADYLLTRHYVKRNRNMYKGGNSEQNLQKISKEIENSNLVWSIVWWSDLNLLAAADKLKSVGDIFKESRNFEAADSAPEFPTMESIENPIFLVEFVIDFRRNK